MTFLANSLEDEIYNWIVYNDPDACPSSEDILKCVDGNHFNFLKFFYDGVADLKFFTSWLNKEYETLILENILNSEIEILQKIKLNQNYFQIPLANPLIVKITEEEKVSSKYPILENTLNLKNIKLNYILDIEFFESLKSHDDISNYLLSENNIYSNCNFNNMTFQDYLLNHKEIWEFHKSKLLDWNVEDLNFEIKNFAMSNLENLIDYYDCNFEKVDDKLFTSFLDTEKIHLQFANVTYKNKQHNILAYFGYGNYYPFTGRSIDKKNASNKRFNKLDYLNGKNGNNSNYYLSELNKSSTIRKNNLLEIINLSQKNYLSHFNDNFSFDFRLNSYENKNCLVMCDSDKSLNNFIKINPVIRTKSAALISYLYFQNNFNF